MTCLLLDIHIQIPTNEGDLLFAVLDISAQIIAGAWQCESQLVLQSKPEEDVLYGAAGTLVGLQESNFMFLLAVFVARVVTALRYLP